MPLELGLVLNNRYRIERELGRGGMGAVYYALDESLSGLEVAIKENLFVSPESERQFRREAALLATLRHPSLPRVTDYFVIEGQGQYLVMDFIPGEDAKHALDNHPDKRLPQDVVLRWANDLMDALHFLHTRPSPVIHRDIKPGNIKITPEGRAVLVDFGLAKASDTATTTLGAKAFTPGFAPPEQYGIGRTDPRTDIYALGATLYTLLTGQMPAESIQRAMGKLELTPARAVCPDISPHVAEAIERALALKPEDRWETVRDFREALTHVPVVADQPEVAEPPALPPPPSQRRVSPLALTASLMFGVAVLAGGLWAFGQFAPPAAPGPTPTPGTVVVLMPTITPGPIVSTVASATPDSVVASATPVDAPIASATPVASPTSAATPRGGGASGEIAYVKIINNVPQIHLMNVDPTLNGQDTYQRALTRLPGGACQPAWSPDGARLLFISPCAGKQTDYAEARLYVLTLSDGSIAEFARDTATGFSGTGVFDADWGMQGVLVTVWANGQPRLWRLTAEGRVPTKLSPGVSKDRHGSWNPDGTRIVFVNESRDTASGLPTLYWSRSDGSFEGSAAGSQVTRDQRAGAPAWSPNGDTVAYVVQNQIFTVLWNAKGFNATQLTQRGPNADPNWSPDGQWLVFESWRDNANHDIYIMRADGSLQTPLTTDTAFEMQPAWRP